MGSIYKRGKVYWIKYSKNGRPLRESTRSTKESDAKRLLKKREGEISEGKIPGIYFDRVRFEEMVEDFLRDYRINKKKSLVRAERSVNHLKAFFEGMRIPSITTPMVNTYVEERMKWTCTKCEERFLPGTVGHRETVVCPACRSNEVEQGAANATINRELAALKRMLNIGAEQTPPKVDRVPHIPMLSENNVRKGFFEHGDFLALREALPDFLRGFITFGYKTGWRVDEIRNLTWGQVDRDQGIVRLEVGETKNDEARTVYLDVELKEIFESQWETRKGRGVLSTYVFTNEAGTDKVKDFRGSWFNACEVAGIGKRLFHDFRRTAVRNMVRSGIPERVAMMVSGHKTRSVFDRYNIVNEADLKLAAQKQECYLESQMGTNSGTIHHLDTKREVDRND